MNFSHDLWALRLWAAQSRWWKLSPCCKTGLTVTDKLTWWRWRMRSTIFLLHNGAPPDWTRHAGHKLLSEAGFRKVWFEQFHRGNMWTWMLVSWLSAFSFLLFNLCSLSALAFISSIFLQTTSKNLLSWFLYKKSSSCSVDSFKLLKLHCVTSLKTWKAPFLLHYLQCFMVTLVSPWGFSNQQLQHYYIYRRHGSSAMESAMFLQKPRRDKLNSSQGLLHFAFVLRIRKERVTWGGCNTINNLTSFIPPVASVKESGMFLQ